MAAASPSSSLPLKPIILSITPLFLIVSPTKPSPSRLLLQSPPPAAASPSSKTTAVESSITPASSPQPRPPFPPNPRPPLLLPHQGRRTHFSRLVIQLSSHLRLSPSMATIVTLGNGPPDIFASAAALHGGQTGTWLAAILSAGASAFVVGSVADIDIFFYLLPVSGLFYAYLSAEIFLWQAVGLYVFFVGLLFWIDFGGGSGGGGGGGGGENNRNKREEEEVEMMLAGKENDVEGPRVEDGKEPMESSPWGFFSILEKTLEMMQRRMKYMLRKMR